MTLHRVPLQYAGKTCQGQTLCLIGPICKLRRKRSILNTTPSSAFTTFYFLLNSKMGPVSQMLDLTRLYRLPRNKHSVLFGPSVSYKENEVLLILHSGLYSQHFIFFLIYKWVEQVRCCITQGSKGLLGHWDKLNPCKLQRK